MTEIVTRKAYCEVCRGDGVYLSECERIFCSSCIQLHHKGFPECRYLTFKEPE